jgi:hypothetical protein
VISLTGDERFYSLLDDPGLGLEIIPFLQVYGQVEEKYLLAQKGLVDFKLSNSD